MKTEWRMIRRVVSCVVCRRRLVVWVTKGDAALFGHVACVAELRHSVAVQKAREAEAVQSVR